MRRVRRKQKWDIERLKRNNISFQRSVENAVERNRGMNINQRWTEFKGVVQRSAQEHIGYERKERIKKPWITREIINKIDERRKWKNKSDEEGKKRYRQLNNEIRREAAKQRKCGGVENVMNWRSLMQMEERSDEQVCKC